MFGSGAQGVWKVVKCVLFMKLRVIITFISISLACTSSAKRVPKYIRDKFTNCYTGENTNLGNLVNINGYYELKRLFRTCSGYGKNLICNDTAYNNIVFYADGTFLHGFSEKFPTVNYGYWGIYRIVEDTIITQYITYPSLLAPWDGWEDKYLIIDRETLVIIPSETKAIFKTTKQEREHTAKYMSARKFFPVKFKESNKPPLPDSWLKKQSWTSCNCSN